jgi:hypothetical protein
MIDIQIKSYKQRRDQSTISVFCTKKCAAMHTFLCIGFFYQMVS